MFELNRASYMQTGLSILKDFVLMPENMAQFAHDMANVGSDMTTVVLYVDKVNNEEAIVVVNYKPNTISIYICLEDDENLL